MTLEFEAEGVESTTFRDGEHPLELFIQGDTEMREEVILNHPDVVGFIYLNEDVITKAYLPKKMINFKTNTKVIVAVSGDSEEYTPFSVQVKALLSDSLHLTDFNNFTDGTAIIPIGKHLKDNAADLPDLPNEFSTAVKINKLRIIAFPLIIPLIKGLNILEGDIGEDEVYDKLGKAHDIYADWAYLHSKKYVMGKDFFVGDKKCPIPERTCDNISYSQEIPFKVLFKSKKESDPYNLAKMEVAKFILQNKPAVTESETSKIPDEVDILEENKTIVTTSTTASSINTKNDRIQAFLAILFSKPLYDRKDNVVSLIPAILTDEIKEIITSTSSTSEQARELSDSIEALADDISS